MTAARRTGAEGADEATDGRVIRVMSFNLLRLTVDLDEAARVVREVDPDVLGVQEPPRAPWGRVRLRRFARAAGLEVVLAGRGTRTTALLVAPRVDAVHDESVLRLRWRGSRVVRRWWARRGVAVAVVGWLRVAVVHLALDDEERLRHADEILGALADDRWPTAVLGDLNEPPSGAVWARLGQRWRDADPGGAPTFPARSPRVRIDAVLVDERIDVRDVRVVGSGGGAQGSDHLPVVADLAQRRL